MSFTDFNNILSRLTDEYEDLNRQFNEDVVFLNDFDKVLRDNHGKVNNIFIFTLHKMVHHDKNNASNWFRFSYQVPEPLYQNGVVVGG